MSHRRLLLILALVELPLIGAVVWSFQANGDYGGLTLGPLLVPILFVASLVVGVLCGLRPDR